MTTEQTAQITTEEALALKLGFKHKNGKADIKKMKEFLLDELMQNADRIELISGENEEKKSNIGNVFKLHKTNGIAQVNAKRSNETTERIEQAIQDAKERGVEKITKSYISRTYTINWDSVQRYAKEHPNAFN